MIFTTQRKYFAPFVFGSIDGLVTTFAVVSGVIGASLAPSIILVLGFANLLADGFSMGVSNYLSEKSETKEQQALASRTPWKSGTVTFTAFILIGAIPLIPFLLALVEPVTSVFGWSMFCTALAFIAVGYAKGIATGHSKIWSSVETLTVGSVAAGIAYYVGHVLSGLIA